MGLRDYNRDRLTWWLNHDYPERIAGRYNSEQPMEARKLESRVIAKSGALDRIDAHYGCEQDHLRDKRTLSKGLSETDRYLLRIIFKWLPTQGLWNIYYQAARHVLLSDSTAGGVVELERLEGMGDGGNIIIADVARLARRAFEMLLDKTVDDNKRLEVETDERAKSNTEAYHQERGEMARLRDDWVRNKFFYYRTERRMSQPDSVKRLAEDYDRDPETIRAALRNTKLWNVSLAWETPIEKRLRSDS